MHSALRSLAKSPGFVATAILTLALGIGLSTSSFSMANALLLRNLPYPQPDQLVRLFSTSPRGQSNTHSPGNFLQLRDTATSFVGISAQTNEPLSLSEAGQPVERVNGMYVGPNFFDLMGVQPFLGRGFSVGEDLPDKPGVTVITHRLWVRRYAADPTVIGRTVRLNTQPYTIIGVLPPMFDALIVWGAVDFIAPFVVYPGHRENFHDSWIHAVARLKPGVSLAQAQSELALLAAQLEKAQPKDNASIGERLIPLYDANMDNVSRSMLWMMTAISLVMLLIACANLANLQVARAFGRSREFAVRSALGGGRRQLMLPLLVESLILAVGGGIGALFIASWSNAIISHFLRVSDEVGFALPLDGRVLAFAGAASLLSGLAFGLAPAWLASRAPAAEALKEGSRGSTGGRSHHRLKSILIVGEVALALALVGAAASFGFGAKSFIQRQVGWDIDGLFSGYLALPYNQYNDDAKNRIFQHALLDKLTAIPGVEQAALCNSLPIFGLGGQMPLFIEGQTAEAPGREPLTQFGIITSDFFSALRIPLKAGAFFAKNLTEKDPPVAIVNEAFARRFWPGASALGHRVRLGDNPQLIEIVGVVGDAQLLGRFDTPETSLQLYRPTVQTPSRYLSIVLRSPLQPAALTKSVRDAVASLDPDLPVASPGSARADIERMLSNLNLVVVNLGISAGLGLLIAAVGLFGVISQLTLQRTRDIGIRMALGALPGDIVRQIVGEGSRLLLIGIALGTPLIFLLNRALSRVLPAMPFPGLWLLALNLAVLGTTMLLACYLPARRAARINPTDALRAE